MTTYQKVNKSVVSNSDKNKILINQCESYMLTNINLLKCIQESNTIRYDCRLFRSDSNKNKERN